MATSSISQFICIITMFTWNTKWQFHLLIRKKVWWAFLLHCSATSPSPPFSSTERCFSPEASHSVLLGLSFYIQTRYRADQRQATKSGSRENNGNAGVLELESEAVSPGPNPCCVPSSYCAKEVNGWRPRKKQETEGRRSYSPSRLRLLRSQCIPHWGVPSRLRLPRSQCIPHGGGVSHQGCGSWGLSAFPMHTLWGHRSLAVSYFGIEESNLSLGTSKQTDLRTLDLHHWYL